MKSRLITITTYKKPEAIRNIVKTLHEQGYTEQADIIIAEDEHNVSKANSMLAELRPYGVVAYRGGKNGGVWKNKNRCIDFFLSHEQYKHLLMLDDDLTFKAPGLFDRLIEAGEKADQLHITTYLGGYKDYLSQDDFFVQFPPILEDENLYWCGGSQGIGLYYTRELVKVIGYFKHFPYKYGYEHDEHSNRALRAQGFTPLLKPILIDSPLYFECASIPNNYTLEKDKIDGPQAKKYAEYMALTMAGVSLNESNSRLDMRKEFMLI